MFYTIAAVLVVVWLLGLAFHIAGALIHLLLLLAVVAVVVQLLKGRKT